LTHRQDGFDLLDAVSQVSISGYLPPHPPNNTAGRTESGHIEFPADLLQIASPQRPQQKIVTFPGSFEISLFDLCSSPIASPCFLHTSSFILSASGHKFLDSGASLLSFREKGTLFIT